MVRILLPFSLMSAAWAMQIAEHGSLDFEGMKTVMVNIAAQTKKGEISDAQARAIQGFLDQINNVLVPALNQDKDVSQAALNAAYNAVNKCNTDRTNWTVTTLAGLHTSVSTDLGTHNSCRAQENVTLTNLTAHCKTLEEQVCSWTICDVPSFANGDSDEVDTYMCCLDTFFTDNKPTYYTARQACIDATTLHHQQTAVCDGNQATFEATFCSRETTIQNYCSSYQQCRCSTETTFENIKKETEDLEAIFQAQFVALQHLTCYGNSILANNTDLSSCDAVADACVAYTDCPTINYETPDDAISCDEPYQNHPCQAAFKNEFYGQYDDSCTPVDDCEPCGDANVQNNVFGGATKPWACCDCDAED